MVAGVRKLIEAEAAQSCAIRRVHAIRAMHLGANDVSRHSPALPRPRHHGPGRAELTCDAEEVAAASADAEPIAFDDLGHRKILAPLVVRATDAFLLCQHRALVAKHCVGVCSRLRRQGTQSSDRSAQHHALNSQSAGLVTLTETMSRRGRRLGGR